MNYFINSTSVDTIKTIYRNLARQNHPDLGGNEETMKEINKQYHDALKGSNGINQNMNKEEAPKFYVYEADIEQEMMDALFKIIILDGVNAELRGSWLWVSGDTKPHRELFKSLKMLWSSHSSEWYLKPSNTPRKFYGKTKTSGKSYKAYGFKAQQQLEAA
jgi:hypothetical protein